mmetsp:Transcript_28595/g.51691  ORF Transcript_28595/g.51691 Transcript_28595/m.51691 type:complete len:90 (+) Transcript_28595:639-908(+)
MIAHQVRIFREVDGLEGQFPETLLAFALGLLGGGDASSAEFGAHAILTVYHCISVLLLIEPCNEAIGLAALALAFALAAVIVLADEMVK